MPLELSPGQAEAIAAIEQWYNGGDSQVFRMFGPAGTGKTTIARLVPAALGVESWHYGAFSGKAANVLRSKGCEPSATLHSLVYNPPVSLESIKKSKEKSLDLLLEEMSRSRAANGAPGDGSAPFRMLTEVQEDITAVRAEIADITDRIRLFGSLYWEPLGELGPLPSLDLLVADEVSMVNDQMARDILDSGVRVLVLGDPEQLPPVNGDGFFTRAAADITLTEVHRQALDSPVLNLATRVRTDGLSAVMPSEYVPGKGLDYTQFDRILCWRRATRWSAIRYLRKQLGRASDLPEPGDVVMNLVNNRDLGLFNGQSFVVLDCEPDSSGDGERLVLTVHEEGTDPSKSFEVDVFNAAFNEEDEKAAGRMRLGGRGPVALMTHAHALTVHKAQGSEWGNVCLIDETGPMIEMKTYRSGYGAAIKEARRWFYTGVTRASESVTLVRKS